MAETTTVVSLVESQRVLDPLHERDEVCECIHGIYTGASECYRCTLHCILGDDADSDSLSYEEICSILERHRAAGNKE